MWAGLAQFRSGFRNSETPFSGCKRRFSVDSEEVNANSTRLPPLATNRSQRLVHTAQANSLRLYSTLSAACCHLHRLSAVPRRPRPPCTPASRPASVARNAQDQDQVRSRFFVGLRSFTVADASSLRPPLGSDSTSFRCLSTSFALEFAHQPHQASSRGL